MYADKVKAEDGLELNTELFTYTFQKRLKQDETSLRDLKVYEAKSNSRIIEVNQAHQDSDSDSELSEEENQESQSGSSAGSRPRGDEDKILQNCNLILEVIGVSFNEEHLDNSYLLNEDCIDLKASTETA